MAKLDLTKYVEEIYSRREITIRFGILGNAGGTVATLGLIGTSIGASAKGTYPVDAFYVLCLFVFGLVGGGIVRFAELYKAIDVAEAAAEFSRDNETAPTTQKWSRLISTFGILVIHGALLGGVIQGLTLLYSLAK